jgi:uncharacterized membrane protein
LILQSIALGLGAIPLFWIAQRELSSPWLRVGLIISYLLYPALGYINFFDFHPVALTIPLLLLAYWALLERRHLLFWTAVLLTLATKEELVVPVGAFAIYCLTQPSWRRTGFRLLALTAFWAVLSFAVIVYFNEGRAYRYVDAWSHLISLLSSGAGRGANTQPSTINLLTPESLLYLLYLLFPLGFLPLLGPGLLAVSIPSLTYLLLSSRPALHSFDSQYSAVLIPWLFLATVQALAKLERWSGPNGQQARSKRLALYLLLTCTVVSNLLLNSIFWYGLSGSFTPGPNHVEINRALALIPPQAGVATINSFGAQLAHRRYLMGLDRYSTPLPQSHLRHIDYVLLDLDDCRAIRSPNPRNTYAEMVLQLIDSQEFGVRYWSDPILLLERGLPSGPELDEMRDYVHKLESEKRPCWP